MRNVLKIFVLAVLLIDSSNSILAQSNLRGEHKFFDKTNIVLFSADALTRTLDAQSTERLLNNPCKCFKEDTIPFITGKGNTATYLFSYAITGGLLGVSYLAHRKGHHLVERLIPVGDIVFDGSAVVNNYSQHPKK